MRLSLIFWIVLFAFNFGWLLFAGFFQATSAQITSLAGVVTALFGMHLEKESK